MSKNLWRAVIDDAVNGYGIKKYIKKYAGRIQNFI